MGGLVLRGWARLESGLEDSAWQWSAFCASEQPCVATAENLLFFHSTQKFVSQGWERCQSVRMIARSSLVTDFMPCRVLPLGQQTAPAKTPLGQQHHTEREQLTAAQTPAKAQGQGLLIHSCTRARQPAGKTRRGVWRYVNRQSATRTSRFQISARSHIPDSLKRPKLGWLYVSVGSLANILVIESLSGRDCFWKWSVFSYSVSKEKGKFLLLPKQHLQEKKKKVPTGV